jgi:hypothetical protein
MDNDTNWIAAREDYDPAAHLAELRALLHPIKVRRGPFGYPYVFASDMHQAGWRERQPGDGDDCQSVVVWVRKKSLGGSLLSTEFVRPSKEYVND